MRIEDIERLCTTTPNIFDNDEYAVIQDWIDDVDKILPKFLAVAKAAGICVGDGIVECPEGGPSFYKVENRLADSVRIALKALEQE